MLLGNFKIFLLYFKNEEHFDDQMKKVVGEDNLKKTEYFFIFSPNKFLLNFINSFVFLTTLNE